MQAKLLKKWQHRCCGTQGAKGGAALLLYSQ
jgi:hypothetical protein